MVYSFKSKIKEKNLIKNAETFPRYCVYSLSNARGRIGLTNIHSAGLISLARRDTALESKTANIKIPHFAHYYFTAADEFM